MRVTVAAPPGFRRLAAERGASAPEASLAWRDADPSRGAGRLARRARPFQPGDRWAPLHRQADRGDPPVTDLPQAGCEWAQRARVEARRPRHPGGDGYHMP